MTIPEVRVELLTIADEINAWGLPGTMADRIRYLVGQMHRRPLVRRADPSTPFVHPVVIREYAEAHPDDPYMDIAMAVGTTIGRVSEALAGKRT